MMSSRLMFVIVVSFLLAAAASAVDSASKISMTQTEEGVIHAPGDLIFQDEFNTLNSNVWKHEVNINGGYVSLHVIFN
jgi:hypothetical protein